MKKFLTILKIMIFQILSDIFESIWDFLVVQWEYRYEIIKVVAGVSSVLFMILFNIWLFITLFTWAEHPFVIFSVIFVTIVGGAMQASIVINREDVYKWFLDYWNSASQKYKRNREIS